LSRTAHRISGPIGFAALGTLHSLRALHVPFCVWRSSCDPRGRPQPPPHGFPFAFERVWCWRTGSGRWSDERARLRRARASKRRPGRRRAFVCTTRCGRGYRILSVHRVRGREARRLAWKEDDAHGRHLSVGGDKRGVDWAGHWMTERGIEPRHRRPTTEAAPRVRHRRSPAAARALVRKRDGADAGASSPNRYRIRSHAARLVNHDARRA
jgi:hypothetical protein